MEEKEELIEKIREAHGGEPRNTRALLRILVLPEVIEYTKRYIEANDTTNMCLRFEAPWSCAKEANARYKNIKYGWLGGAAGIGFDESWCENCRKKIMEE